HAATSRVDDRRLAPNDGGLGPDRLGPGQVGLFVEHLVGESLDEDRVIGVGAPRPIMVWPEIEAAVVGLETDVKPSITGSWRARAPRLAADAQRPDSVVMIRPGEGHGRPGACHGKPTSHRAHGDPQSDVTPLATAADRQAVDLDLPDRSGASP